MPKEPIDAAQKAAAIQVYRSRLARHDWYFEHSDYQPAWREGRADRAALTAMREHLDPDGAVWNYYAPEGFKVKEKKNA